jgi:predicted outer membrane repeat protein
MFADSCWTARRLAWWSHLPLRSFPETSVPAWSRGLALLLILATVSAVIALPAQAQLYVREGASGTGSQASPYGSLQDALADGSSLEIRIAEGTYVAASTDRTVSFVIADGVQLLGGWAPDFSVRDPGIYATILSGDIDGDGSLANNTRQILQITTPVSSATVIDGVVVDGGNADDILGQSEGGGLFINAGSPTIRDVTFRDNSATVGGGAVLCDAASPTFENVTFDGNGGGTLGGGAILALGCTVTISDASFSNQTSQAGAGMYSLVSQLTLRDATFVQNTAVEGGGAIFNDSGTLVVSRAVFDRNTTTGTIGGGAIYDVGGTGRINNAVFAGNETITGSGGALEIETGGAYDVANAIFTGNAAPSDRGGAIFLSGSTLSGVHLTTTSNSASSGPMLFASTGSTATLENVILWNEPAPVTDGTGSIQFGAALINGGLPAGATLLPGAPAVRTSDPQFEDADGADNTAGTVDDNLRTISSSDAVDRGLLGALPVDFDDLDGDGNTLEELPVDLDGTPRVEDSSLRDAGNGGPDLGAYEAPSTLVISGTADSPVEDGALGDDFGWRMMAVPAASTVGDIADDIVFGPLGLSGEQPTAMIYQWDDAAPNDTSSFTGDWNGLSSLADPLPTGEGFILFFFDDSLDPIRPDSPLVFDVPGPRVTSNVNVTGLSTTALFHFLGNPYARSFDIDNLAIGGATGFQAFVEVYDPATAAYQRIEQGTTSPRIAPWQGFFIERSTGSTATSVTFSAAGKTSGSEFVGKSSPAPVTRIGLALSGTGTEGQTVATDRLEVSFRPGARAGWDVWDGTNLGGIFAERPQLVVLGDRETKRVEKIHDSQPLPLQGAVWLPLQVKAAGWEGPLKIRASTWENVPENWAVGIVDKNGTATPTDDVRVQIGPDGDAFQWTGGGFAAAKQVQAENPPHPVRQPGPIRDRSDETFSDRKAGGALSDLYLAIIPTGYQAKRSVPTIQRLGRRAKLTWTHDAKESAEVVVEHRVGEGAWAIAASHANASATIKASSETVVEWMSADLLPGDHTFRLRYGSGAEAAYSTEVHVAMEMDEPFEVRPPAPNPVRSRASMHVAVRDAQHICADVYDMLGRRIAVLYDGRLRAGQMHTLPIDVAALRLTSGAYLVRITGDTFTETQRFTVVR